MIGSEKQITWARNIQEGWRQRFPDEQLPEHPMAQFWIETRHYSLEELHQAALTEIYSPCTKTYPKLMRDDIAHLLHHMDTFAVFDTETSGLLTGAKKVKNPEIVEMSIVAVATGEVLFDSLFKPKDMNTYLQSEARKMHAWPEEAYHYAPSFPEMWKEIIAIISRYHLVAYNTDFDVPILRHTAHLWGLSMPRIKCTCAMETFQAFMTTEDEGWTSYKLCEACEIAGIKQENYGTPHTALADALVTRELLLRMQRCIRGDLFWDQVI